MRILLVTSHFHPENFKANDMAFELQRRGHDITVLAPIPDYPQGRYHDGYGVFKRRSEVINGVKVIRCFVTPRRQSPGWLILNYATHTFSSTLRGLWIGLRHHYDAVLVHETSPVTVGIPAVLIKKMQRIPMHFWVLDLWPESLEAAGGIHNPLILGLFRSITSWIYRNSDHILISSKGFRRSINAMGDFDHKIEFFPNWVDDILATSAPYDTPDFPQGFNAMFAGNIGDAQDMPHILQAAELLKDTNINIILVGDGRRKEWVEQEIAKRGIKNVYLLGRHPLKAMPTFFAKADILFLALKNYPIFSLTVPAKLQAYMSAGKPIVAMINGEGADTIADADCGKAVAAEDATAFAALLREYANMSPTELLTKGQNAKAYATEHYIFKNRMDALCNALINK